MMSAQHLLSLHVFDDNHRFPGKVPVNFHADPVPKRVRENVKPGSTVPGICTAYIGCSNY